MRLRTEALGCKAITKKRSLWSSRKGKNTAEPKDELDPAARCKDVAKKMPLQRENKNRKKEVPQLRVCVSRHSTGGDDETRTHYLYNANVALYQMSYAPKYGSVGASN